MRKYRSWLPALVALGVFVLDGSPRDSASKIVPSHVDASTMASHNEALTTSRVSQAYGRLPLRFEQNDGQFDDAVRFVAVRGGASLALRDDGATLSLRGAGEEATETSLTFRVAGGRRVAPVATEELVTKSNYFLGNDRSKWRRNVKNYGRVTYPGVLDGVDLVYHGGDGQIEYDFIVRDGADVASIAMNVEGHVDELSLADDGALLVHTKNGVFVQPRPRVYQRDLDGKEIDVASRYRLVGPRAVGFEVAAYDTSRELVIDPVLAFSTYLGGAGNDIAYAVAVDPAGHAYVGGCATLGSVSVTHPAFPTTDGAFQASHAEMANNVYDGFVAKFNATGTALEYATYLGGLGADVVRGIAVDAQGNAYVGGQTAAADFPTTDDAFQETRPATGSHDDGFVVKLNATGSDLEYATYLGGPDSAYNEAVLAIAVDAAGHAYVTGRAVNNSTFPTTVGAFDRVRNDQDAFVTKLSPNGRQLIYSTFLGGTGSESAWGITLDAQNRAVVVGQTSNNTFPTLGQAQQYSAETDAFVTKLNEDGTDLVFSTFLGGEGDDIARGVALDAQGNVYVVGETTSRTDSATPFPNFNAAQSENAGLADIFVVKFDPDGANHLYATFLGSSGNDRGYAIDVSSDGYAVVAGLASASGYPLQTAYAGHSVSNDAVVTKLRPNGGSTLVYSTYLGGDGSDIAWGVALAPDGDAIVVGQTVGTFPTTPGAFDATRSSIDAFVTKFTSPAPELSAGNPTIAPRASETISVTGGSGEGYTLALQTNASGGSLAAVDSEWVYTAGATGSVTDVIRVTDSEGAVGTLELTIGPGVSISPLTPSVPPRGSLTLSATGGSGESFSWSLSGTPNGTITTDGVYTAGTAAGVADTVVVEDSLGNTASVQISVGGGIAISPATPTTPPRGALSFSATGGADAGFNWKLTSAPSGGTITAAGAYKAGATADVTDVVEVNDALGNTATINVVVGKGVSITPASTSVAGGSALTFSATGGSGSFSWSLQAAPSNGVIDATTGLYSAGVVSAPVTDIVLATDTLGNTATSLVEVTVASTNPGGETPGGEEPPPPPADTSSADSSEGGCSVGALGASSSSASVGVLVIGLGLALARARRRR